jgi:hypothetical protein
MITDLVWESVCVEDIFVDIIYTTENPLILKTETVFKEGDKIKRIKKEERFELSKDSLLGELLKNGKEKEIYFKQKGILRLFRKYNKTKLTNIIFNLTEDDWIIMGPDTRRVLDFSPLSFCGNLVIDNRLKDKCIIGNRKSRCILNKETREYYFDKDSITVLTLI